MKLELIKKARAGRVNKILPYYSKVQMTRYPHWDGWHGTTSGSHYLLLPEKILVLVWKLPEGRLVHPLSNRCDCLRDFDLTLNQAKEVIRNSKWFPKSNPNLNNIDWTDWPCPVCHLRAERPFHKLIRLLPDPSLRDALMSYDSDLEEVVKALNPAVEPNHYRMLGNLKFKTCASQYPGLTFEEIAKQSEYDVSYVRRAVQRLEGVVADRRDLYGRPYPFVETKSMPGSGVSSRKRYVSLTDMGKVLQKYLKI